MANADSVRVVYVILTTRCNLSCSYCYQNRRSARNMSWTTLRSALELLLASQQQEVALVLYGGEPLLEARLISRAVDFVESKVRVDQRVRIGLATNGLLLGGQHAEYLAVHGIYTQLSFDGTAAAQNLRGKDTYPILDRLLDRIRHDHLGWYQSRLTVAVAVLPETLGYLPEAVEYLIGKGVQRIDLAPNLGDTSGWQIDQIQELERAFNELDRICRQQISTTGRVSLSILRRSEGQRLPPPASRPMCAIGDGQALSIDVDGQVSGCAMLAESYQQMPSELLQRCVELTRLGHLKDPALHDRLERFGDATAEARIFHHKEEKYSEYGQCRECRYLSACSVCPISIGHIPRNTDPNKVPGFLCAFNLVANRFRELAPSLRDPLKTIGEPLELPPSIQKLIDFVDSMSQ